jgi:hypothetical protein
MTEEIIDDAEIVEAADADEPGTGLVVYEDEDGEWVEAEESQASVEEQAAQVAAEIADATAEMARLGQELVGMQVTTPDETGTALVPSTQTADMARKRLASLRADAMKAAQRIEAKQAEIMSASKRVEALMRKQQALAEEKLAPLMKFVERLQEGIWMVNLYLGRDEEIVTLYDDEPAAADTMIAIRQMVLAMDEECALHPEYDGIDATNIEEFDKWLQADFAHVEQIAPEEKCVVALRPRFNDKDYGDAWKNQAVSEANKRTYFLIRNGGKVYRTWTDFAVGDRLVPTADEFSSFFYTDEWGRKPSGRGILSSKHRIPVTPGTPAWERAEEQADARQRHYMRVGLILQGLVDRTTVFHPLPDSGVNFLDFEHNGKSWRFVMDAEMALTTGRTPFYEWLAAKQEQLTVGMRIVGYFRKRYHRDGSTDWDDRIHPRNAELPPNETLLTIEDRQADGWLIRYERKSEVYDPKLWVPSPDRPGWGHRGGYRTPKQRASALLMVGDRDYLPFDLVTVEEMEEYLRARGERHAYITMFPLLHAAIAAKRREAEEEAPFRTMLAGVLMRENGVDLYDAEDAIPGLVEWWKLSNREHRPLVGSESEQARAVQQIVAEHARRLKAKKASRSAVQHALTLHPHALLIARKRDGKYVVLVPANDDNVFVHEYTYGARALMTPGGKPDEAKLWTLMPPQSRRVRWLVAYQAERLDSWDFNASLSRHLTGPEIDRLAEQVIEREQEDGDAMLAAVAYDPRKRHFRVWRFNPNDTSGYRGPEYDDFDYGWKREGGRAVLGRPWGATEGRWADQVKPWDTRTKDGKPSQWRDTTRNLFDVRFHDPKVEALYDQARRDYLAERAAANEKSRRVNVWINSVREAWEARNEARVYAEFLEEYLDPELWEGHRKTLKPEVFAYPYKHKSRPDSWREERDALDALVEYAVEQGIDLDGLTVWEAAQRHFPPSDWFGEPRTWNVSYGGKKGTVTETEQFPEFSDVPVDLRDLRFSWPEDEPRENEPDEEDEW